MQQTVFKTFPSNWYSFFSIFQKWRLCTKVIDWIISTSARKLFQPICNQLHKQFYKITFCFSYTIFGLGKSTFAQNTQLWCLFTKGAIWSRRLPLLFAGAKQALLMKLLWTTYKKSEKKNVEGLPHSKELLDPVLIKSLKFLMLDEKN